MPERFVCNVCVWEDIMDVCGGGSWSGSLAEQNQKKIKSDNDLDLAGCTSTNHL